MIYKSLYGNNFFGYVLDLLGFGVAVAGCFLKDKHWITSSLSRSCQVRCQIDEDADRQILQPVVTVTQSELWNQRVTVINHISDLSRTNRVDAVGEFTSP